MARALTRHLLLILTASCLGGLGLGVSLAGEGHSERIVFTNLSVRQGTADGAVRRILQDRRGSLWFGSDSGLSRFDGFELEKFPLPRVGDAEWTGELRAFAEGADGWFWIGTAGEGLLRFQPDTGEVTRYRAEAGRAGGLSNNSVTSLALEEQSGTAGILWVGTENGLNRFDRSSGTFEKVALKPGSESEVVLAMAPGGDGSIWAVAAGGGLYRKPKGGGTWTAVWNRATEISAIAAGQSNTIWVATVGEGIFHFEAEGEELGHIERQSAGLSLLEDSKGALWVGTAAGADRYDPASESWSSHRHSQQEGSLVAGPILSIFEDKREVLWLGAAAEGGLSRFSLTQSWFPGFVADPDDQQSLTNDSVLAFAEAADGRVWVGTEGGLNRFDPGTGKSEQYRQDPAKPGSLPRDYAPVTLVDSKDRLWVGTRGGGLARLDPGESEFHVFRNVAPDNQGVAADSITAMMQDSSGAIWVAVLGAGVGRWNDTAESFEGFDPEAIGGQMRNVVDLLEDGDRRLWVATAEGGLWWMDPGSRGLTSYLEVGEAKLNPLPSAKITDLATGQGGVIWIATRGGGFSRFDPNSGALRHFTQENARLPHQDALSVIEDNSGLLWVATGAGLIRFDPQVRGFRRFGPSDGLLSVTLNPKSAFKARDGRLYFGGAAGFNILDPSNLPKPLQPPRPLLTTLKLYGNRIEPGEGQVLEHPLAATESFRILHDPRLALSFGFGTLNYATSGRTRYQYRLDGYDQDWREAGDTREANYTRLATGDYVFRVRASPDGRYWVQDEASVRFRVAPPWYQTRWAIGSFVAVGILLVVLAIVGLFRVRMARERARRQQLQNERSQAEAALARQIQYSMLLEQTSAEFRRNLDSSQVFEASLTRIATHFKVPRCFIASCPSDGEGTAAIIGEFCVSPLESIRRRRIPIGNPFFQQLMGSDETLALKRVPHGAPDEVATAEMMGDDRVQTLLAVRTAHLDAPNGMIVLHHLDAEHVWSGDEVKLLQSLAGQLGMAMAQFQLSAKEAQQRLDLEEARRAADAANQAKSDFLAKMTHEVRTPLNAIIGFSEVMSRDEDVSPRQRENLEIINSAGEHLLGVITDILEVSKIEAGGSELSMEVFELEKLLRSVCGMVGVKAQEKSIGLEMVRLSELPTWVETDKNKLRQVLLNLMGNAVKFTKEGGVALRVGAKLTEEHQNPDEETRSIRLEFEIFDTGPGMSEADQKMLFQKFVQTETGKRETQGTGLGLAISKGFVDLIGGEIGVMSHVGFGTLFNVAIPCVEHIRAAASPHAELPGEGLVLGLEPGHAEVRVLVAEDQPLNRLLMRKLLDSAGFTLEEAVDGVAAVEKCREWRPDIIFMDEDMPRMRGTEAARMILDEAGPNPPVIVSLTAFALDDQRRAALDAGCSDFLAKPFKREELFAMIARYLPVRYAYDATRRAA